MFEESLWLKAAALLIFVISWMGYTAFAEARRRANVDCLSGLLHQYRLRWVMQVVERDNRVADSAILGTLERSVAFFASSSVLIVAGLVTVMASTDKAFALMASLPLAATSSMAEWELKLLLLVSIFVYTFFKFTWALRQYGFASVMLGGAPLPGCDHSEKQRFGRGMAKLLSLAGHEFNMGLRAYYFGLASLAWFLNSTLFIALTLVVVGVLYRREFHSRTLESLLEANDRA